MRSLASRVLLALSVGCLSLAFPGKGEAGFTLVEREARAGSGAGFQAVLHYEARPLLEFDDSAEAADRSSLFPDEPHFVVLSDSVQDDGSEAAFLATPGLPFDKDAWSVAAEVLAAEGVADASTVDATAAVTLSPVRMGTLDGVRVLVEPARGTMTAGEPARIESARIVVSGPALPALRRGMDAQADTAFARLARSLFLNGEELEQLPTEPATRSATRRTVTAPPGDWRLSYRGGEEIFRVPLATLGIDASDADELLLVHHGEALPVGGTIGDDVWFYAPRRHTLDDRTDAVFATPTGASGASMPSRAAFDTLAPAGTEVALVRTRRYAERNEYQRFLNVPLGERFQYYRVQNPTSANFGNEMTLQLSVPDRLTETDVELSVGLWGYNQTGGYDPDHFADFTLEGVSVPRHEWKGRTFVTPSWTVDLGTIPAPGTLEFEHVVPDDSSVVLDGAGIDVQYFDWVELEWTGYPRAEGGAVGVLDVPAEAAPQRVTLGGFPVGTEEDDLLLLDVTDPVGPVRVLLTAADLFTDGDGGVAVEWEVAPTGGRFHVQLLTAIAEPDDVAAAETLPALLPSGVSLDAIYVRPPEFAAALAPLIALRHPDGTAVELNPRAAYNAFNGGQESPEAIREALAELVDLAEERAPLPSVLLVGHGSLDPRDYLGEMIAPQVPTFRELSVVTSAGQMENPIDYPYTLLNGDDNIPDAMVARLHPRTVAQLELAVARILAHDALVEDFRELDRPGLFIADTAQAGDNFPADQPSFMARWEAMGRTALRIDRPDHPNHAALREAIRAEMEADDGLSFVMYTGHGFNNMWVSSSMFNHNHAGEFETDDRWPLVSTFTCLNGYYAFPTNTGPPSLSEAWLFNSTPGTMRGAVANIAPVSLDFYAPQRAFALELLDGFALPAHERPRTAGELFVRAQASFAAKFPSLGKTLREYILFGDPETNLALDPPVSTAVCDWWILH